MLHLERARAATIDGHTILLGSGTYFDFDMPEACTVTIEDVAWGLAAKGRFSGQCVSQISGRRCIYSVAEHCVRMSHAVPQENGYPLDALMHEYGEAVGVDMASPLKALCPDYRAIEKRCDRAGHIQFGVAMRDPALIKRFDLIMLATERRDLMPPTGRAWDVEIAGFEPLPGRIVPWPVEKAAELFVLRYRELTA